MVFNMAKKKDSIDHSAEGGVKNGSEPDPDFSDPEGFNDDITDEGINFNLKQLY